MNIQKAFLHGVDLGCLPERHYFSHSFCFFLHDLIVQTLVEGEKADVFKVIIGDENGEFKRRAQGKYGPDLIHWMTQNGYQEEVLKLFHKQIFAGMLADFGHFVYEALNCSKKGKLTVTYALLRKPLKDNLLYLEWLLAEPKDLLAHFHQGNVNSLALDREPEKKKSIIEKAMKAIDGPYWGTADWIYELRYDKKSNSSFEATWQKAHHLITQAPAYKTEPANFNFIFSQPTAIESQWDFLYSFLPFLLLHSYGVIETIVKQFSVRANGKSDVTDLRVLCGFLIWFKLYWEQGAVSESIRKTISELELQQVSCPKCDAQISIDKDQMLLLYGIGSVACGACGHTEELLG